MNRPAAVTAPIRIRIFARGDERGVADLIVPIQRAEFGISITYDDQPDIKDVPGFYQKGAGQFWVADDGGRVVGTIGLLDIGAREGALRKMFVHADHRGGGVARQLLDTLLAHARAGGLARVYLGTTDKFLAAHRFYEKSGFQKMAVDALPPSFPRMAVDSRFYAIDL